MLQQAGYEVSLEPDHDYQSLLSAAQGYDALVVRSKVNIDRAFIDAVPSLRCIGRVGAGMETIDVAYAESRGVKCINSPEGNRDAVGEHAVGLLLALLNHIAIADSEVRRGLWRREANRGLELGSRTVGLIGFGNMGQAFARRLQGFGCKVLAYDKCLAAGQTIIGTHIVALQQLQAEADVVSLHVPLTDETLHLVDDRFISAMQHPFFLVNTARGAVVNTDALVRGMQSGKVLGAALDVLEYENMNADSLGEVPPSVQWLMQSPRTVLTPHVAGWTVESKERLARVLAEKIISALQ